MPKKQNRKHSRAAADPKVLRRVCDPEVLRAKTIDHSLIVFRGWLTQDDIATISSLGPRGVSQEHDRDDALEFEHQVWRCEDVLPLELLDSLLSVMRQGDHELWRSVPKVTAKEAKHLHPEVEYILYDADACRRNGSPTFPGIGPHVDNSSIITLIAMLSDPSVDFKGGVNRFEDGSGKSIDEGAFFEFTPRQGDVVLFRGELCEHSLTSVTAGTRRILQIELCRKKKGCH